MSNFAVKNLMAVDDASPRAEVEARFTRKYLDSTQLGVSYFHFAPGFSAVDGHRHREQEEAYVVVGGSGAIKLDDETLELRRWDVVRVAPAVVRGFEAGPEGLELIAVGGEKPEGGDGELVSARWPAQD